MALRKRARWWLLGGLAALGALYGGVIGFALGLYRDYPRADAAVHTQYHYQWFADDSLRSPEAYGWTGYEELSFTSDGLKLGGWWFPATDSSVTQTLILVHGRWSSRYRFVSSLPVLDSAQVRRYANVFIPDLRNSGTSDEAPTGFGQLFARDLANAVAYLKQAKGQTQVLLYGQSQGAMASLIYAARPLFVAQRQQIGVRLSGVLLESPLANATANVLDKGAKDGYPGWFVRHTLSWYDLLYTGGFLDSMDLSTLVPALEAPVTLTQTRIDSICPTPIFEQELAEVGPLPENVQVVWFEAGKHARTVWEPANRPRFAALLHDLVAGTTAEAQVP